MSTKNLESRLSADESVENRRVILNIIRYLIIFLFVVRVFDTTLMIPFNVTLEVNFLLTDQLRARLMPE